MESLEELTNIITSRTAEIQTFMSQRPPTTSSFNDTKSLTRLELPHELEQVRDDVFEAMDELSARLRGPLGHFMSIVNPKVNLWISLHLIYNREIAKKLQLDEEVSHADLARRCSMKEGDLNRFLRMAIAFRIFHETENGLVRHSAISAGLHRSQSLHDYLGVCCEEFFPCMMYQAEALSKWPDSDDPAHSAYALAHNNPEGFYSILQREPRRAQRFASCLQETMRTTEYDAGHLVSFIEECGHVPNTIVDIGGSTGTVSAKLLRAFPGMKSTVLDVTEVLSQATTPDDLRGRLHFKVHNMFQEQTERGADAYLLRQILHNWSDSYVVQILKNLVSAMRTGTRLFINEICLPDKGAVRRTEEQYLRALDMSMKLVFNGLERDEKQWRTIFRAVDTRFEIVSIKSSSKSLLSLIEVRWNGQ